MPASSTEQSPTGTDLRRIGEALATFQEARQLYTLAGMYLGGITSEAIPWHIADSSQAILFELGGILESANQLAESEQCYIDLLSNARAAR